MFLIPVFPDSSVSSKALLPVVMRCQKCLLCWLFSVFAAEDAAWNLKNTATQKYSHTKIRKYKKSEIQKSLLLLLTDIIVLKWVFGGEEARAVGNRWNKSDAELISSLLYSEKASSWTGWKEKSWKSWKKLSNNSLLKIDALILHKSKQSSLSFLIFKSQAFDNSIVYKITMTATLMKMKPVADDNDD